MGKNPTLEWFQNHKYLKTQNVPYPFHPSPPKKIMNHDNENGKQGKRRRKHREAAACLDGTRVTRRLTSGVAAEGVGAAGGDLFLGKPRPLRRAPPLLRPLGLEIISQDNRYLGVSSRFLPQTPEKPVRWNYHQVDSSSFCTGWFPR